MGAPRSCGGKITVKLRRRKKSIDDLLDEFVFCTLAQTREILGSKGSVRRGNRYAAKALRVFDELRKKHGDRGRDALATLFQHEEDDVRSAAAALLLRYKTGEAMGVLHEVAEKGKGLIAFESAQAIKRWEEGDWHLDPVPEEEPDS